MYPKERIKRLAQAYRDAVANNEGTRALHIKRFLGQKGLKEGKAGKLHDKKGRFIGVNLRNDL